MKRGIALTFFCLAACISSTFAESRTPYVAFARTYGIVRYFSPNPYTRNWSESDWMKVCALLANRAETQPLEEVFKPLAPTLRLSTGKPLPQEEIPASSAAAEFYRYSGSGTLHVPLLARIFIPGLADYIPYYKQLVAVSECPDSITAPAANRYYNYPAGDGRWLQIQHALPKGQFDRGATHRLLAEAKKYWDSHRLDDKSLSPRRQFIFGLLSDKAVRVADLTVRWNVVRHFYPYYEEENLGWNRQLELYLQQAVQMDRVDSFEELLAWYDCLCRFFNPVKDGHLFVRRDMRLSTLQTTYLPEYHAPVETRVVNDTLLVRTQADEAESWRMLLSLDGRPPLERLQACRAATNAATPAHRDRLAVDKLFASPEYGTPFIIESCDLSGNVRRDTLYAQRADGPLSRRDNPPLHQYENGILYLDATSPELSEKRFLAALTPDVKALCFDLRGLPSLQFEEILAHLIPADAKAPATEVPINSFPFQQGVSWRIEAETLSAKSPHIALPAIFLCDGSTVSWGETILMMVRHYKLGLIVGQTTAGTTGDMTQFDLPLFPFTMTGMRMQGMDREQHHARGILPDRIIPLQAHDLLSGRDSTLEAALKSR